MFPVALVVLALSLSASLAFAAPDQDRPVNKAGIEGRIAELSPPDKGIPDDLIGLNDERQSLATEMSRLRAFVQDGSDNSKEIAVIEKAKTAASQLLAELLKVSDCKVLGESQAEVVKDDDPV